MSISPLDFTDWKAWATAFVREQETQTLNSVTNLYSYVWDVTKPRNGLPPAVQGDIIRVLRDGKAYIAVFNGVSWEYYSSVALT